MSLKHHALSRKKMRSVLLLSMILALLAAETGCSQTTIETEKETDTETAAAEETTSEEQDFSSMTFIERLSYNRQQLSDHLPEKDYDGASFRIGYLDQKDPSDAYTLDWIAEEETGEVFNDSVYGSNLAIEERFHVTLEFIGHSSPYDKAVSAPVLAGEDAYDMLSMHPGFYGSLTLKGLFLPLNDMEYLDFSMPWWVSDAIDALSCDGTLYTAFGLATPVSLMGYAPVVYFNKKIAQDYNVEDLYQVVREGRWTSDYMLQVVQNVHTDLNGDGAYTEEDLVGLHMPRDPELYCYTWLFGGSYVVKDTDGQLKLNFDDTRMEKVFNTARILYETPGVIVEPGYSSEAFKNGNVLFESAHLASCVSYRDVEFDFGLLPNVKLDEAQENYLVNIGGGPQAIPITCSDTERAAILMEACNAEGYKQIAPAYFETMLKYKCARDEESAEMLDLAYSHLTYDGCYLFCPDIIYTLQPYCESNKGYASYIESNLKKWQNSLNKNIAALQEIKEKQ